MDSSSWTIIIVFLGMVLVTQLGRHKFTWWKAISPFLIIGYFANEYAKTIPTTGHDVAAVIICIAVGILFGVGMVFSMRIERNNEGKLFTTCGIIYLVLWIVALGSRVAFAYDATSWDPMQVIHFMINNHLTASVIAPAFVLMTCAMIVIRTLGILVRGYRIKAAA